MSHEFVSSAVRPLVRLSADLVLVVVATALAAGGVLLTAGPVRAALALPLLLFLPGYALVSALFPASAGDARPSRSPVGRVVSRRRGRSPDPPGAKHVPITVGERVALGFGVSVVLLPVVTLALLEFGPPLDGTTVMESLAAVVVSSVVIAFHRRRQLPENERFHLPLDRWFDELSGELFGDLSPADAALNLGILLAILVALSLLTYAVVAPANTEGYTGFAVLTESDSGELVAAGYPSDLTRGETAEVVLSVDNHQGKTVEYTVVVELQRFDPATDSVTERAELERTSNSLADGETWRETVALAPSTAGEDLRLMFYLYEGDAPEDPNVESASEHLHIWVDVTDGQ